MEDSMLTSLFPISHSRYASLPILGGVLEDLCSWLEARGYPPSAIRRRVAAAPLLDRCFQQRQIQSLMGCTAATLSACFPVQKRWTPTIAYALGRSLLEYLDGRGDLASTPPTTSEELIFAYGEHLANVRGLADSTVARHGVIASDFLNFIRYDEDRRLTRVRIAEVEAFLTQASTRVGRITMQKVVGVLRSFLRFSAISGEAPLGLAQQIQSPRTHRGERLVRAMSWKDIVLLLRAVDRSTEKGCRDYTMLLLIATYGLRRSEVAGLALDDIRWRARIVSVPRPKVGTPLALPLTDEVATALVAYLRCRTAETSDRRLFLRVRAPRGPIEPTAVTDVFYYWAAHAGVRVPGVGGPHCLRHGLAMHLLRQNTPLKIIGDLLGHRSVESTGVYLRLQLEDLRDVALPLPASDRAEVRS
jgi:site-specific recombinase XerD